MNEGSDTLTDTENQSDAWHVHCASSLNTGHLPNAVNLDSAHVQHLRKTENVTGATVA